MIHQRKRIVPSRKEGDLSFDEQIDTWKIKQPAFEKESVPVIALIIKNSDDCTEKGLQLIICFVSYLMSCEDKFEDHEEPQATVWICESCHV